jgi:hypothetical protein
VLETVAGPAGATDPGSPEAGELLPDVPIVGDNDRLEEDPTGDVLDFRVEVGSLMLNAELVTEPSFVARLDPCTHT